MVIQCPECRTRFNLADEKLKPEGIKVRCARCREVFAVRKEEPELAPPPEVPVEPVSDDTASAPLSESFTFKEGAGGELPSPTEDEEWNDDPFAGEDKETVAVNSPSPAGETDDFFDFQVTESGPTEEKFPEFETSEEQEELPPFVSASDPFGDEVAGEPPFDIPEQTPTADEITEEEPAFSLETDPLEEDPFRDEFGALDQTGWDEAEEKGEEVPEFSFDEEERTDSFSFPQEDHSPGEIAWEPSAQSEDDNPFAPRESRDNKDEFDFGDPEPEAGVAAVAAASAPSALSSPAAPEPSPAVAAPAVQPPPEEKSAPKKGAPSAPKRRARRSFNPLFLVLVLLLLALTGAAAYFLSQGGPEAMARLLDRFSDPQPAAAPSPIRLVELRGFFVQNSREGQLFIISGKAVNDHGEARSAISVKGIIYDEKGNPLLQQTVFAGNSLSEESLKKLPFSKIEEGMNNQFGDSLSNLNVAPGKSIPFTIAFKGLPPHLAEFTVEVADSRPGAKQ